jgi:hypothetical protein
MSFTFCNRQQTPYRFFAQLLSMLLAASLLGGRQIVNCQCPVSKIRAIKER